MTLTPEQFDRESNYRFALHIMKALLRKGLLNENEFRKANQRLIEKYAPVWGHYPDLIADH